MGAAKEPRWPPYGYNDEDNNGAGPGTPFGTEILAIEAIDDDGDLVVVLDNAYTTFSSTVLSGSPLPTAASTSDPNSLLQKGAATSSVASTGPVSGLPQYSASVLTIPSESPAWTTPAFGSFPTEDAANTQSTPNSTPQAEHQDEHHGGAPPIGAMVVVPIAAVVALIAALFFWRRRRAARRNGTVFHEKLRSPEDGLTQGPPGYGESTNGLLMAQAGAATPLPLRAANDPAAHRTRHADRPPQQPVILDTNMSDGAYLTGIDTSDSASVRSGAAHASGRPSIDVTSITSADEPPPPYRPRSVPSISREASPRRRDQGTAPGAHPGRVAPALETTPLHNPFEHPDDDGASDVSTPVQSPRWRRSGRDGDGDGDAASMISEFSFEHEHR